MTYAIQLTVSNGKKYFGYRNYKGAWTTCMTVPEATTFKTEKGAWRAIQNGDQFVKLEYACSCWQDSLQREGYDVDVVNIDNQKSTEVFVEAVEQSVAESVIEAEISEQEAHKPEPVKEPIALELAELRLAEDALFAQALSSSQDEMLNQFQEIWTRRNEIYQAIEMNITPMPVEAQELTTCTIEEIRAIPKLDMYCPELDGNLFYSLDNKPTARREFKIPVVIVNRYKLTPRQVAILEGKVKVAVQSEPTTNQREDEPCWRDEMYSGRCSEYGYTARDIVMGRY